MNRERHFLVALCCRILHLVSIPISRGLASTVVVELMQVSRLLRHRPVLHRLRTPKDSIRSIRVPRPRRPTCPPR